MNILNDNEKIVDLNKIQWIKRIFINQHYETVYIKPKHPTVHCSPIILDEPALYHPLFPGESCGQRAERLGLLDIWTTVIYCKLSAGRCLTYTGQKAISIYDAWCSKIYGRKKENYIN